MDEAVFSTNKVDLFGRVECQFPIMAGNLNILLGIKVCLRLQLNFAISCHCSKIFIMRKEGYFLTSCHSNVVLGIEADILACCGDDVMSCIMLDRRWRGLCNPCRGLKSEHWLVGVL